MREKTFNILVELVKIKGTVQTFNSLNLPWKKLKFAA